MGYYAVSKGRERGIYTSWEECNRQVHGYSGCKFKKFQTKSEAQNYLNQGEINNEGKKKTSTKNDQCPKQTVITQLQKSEMVAYVDGSNPGNDSSFSWGVVTFSRKFGKVKLNGRSTNQQLSQYRNVAGEIFSAIEAVRFALNNKMTIITIHYDFVGIENWATGTWRARNPLAKSYKDFINSIEKMIDIRFVKVKSHSGNTFNNEADRLAKLAVGI